MPKTFKEAFDGVQYQLENILDVDHGLLPMLVDLHVITDRHREAVKVTWLAVCNGLCRLCIV